MVCCCFLNLLAGHHPCPAFYPALVFWQKSTPLADSWMVYCCFVNLQFGRNPSFNLFQILVLLWEEWLVAGS